MKSQSEYCAHYSFLERLVYVGAGKKIHKLEEGRGGHLVVVRSDCWFTKRPSDIPSCWHANPNKTYLQVCPSSLETRLISRKKR